MALAIDKAREVLPTPGGPIKHKIGDLTDSEVEYPSMIFDGPFSTALETKQVKGLGEKEISEKLTSTMNYDIVIGAIHNLPNIQDFYYMDLSDESIDYNALLDQYFDWELKLARWNGFDTLAHLTYPLRYIVGKYKRPVDMSKYSEIIDEILLTLIKNQKSLEINTAGLRQPIGVTSPDESIVRRYKELGGKLITIGSDAHFAEHLGAGIEQGYELALRCGFDSIALYQNRTPTLIPIE